MTEQDKKDWWKVFVQAFAIVVALITIYQVNTSSVNTIVQRIDDTKDELKEMKVDIRELRSSVINIRECPCFPQRRDNDR